jgi:hypothetical protein
LCFFIEKSINRITNNALERITMKDVEGIVTTISETPNGQLLVTFPRGLKKLRGIGRGAKIRWLLDEKGETFGRVIP